MAYPLKSRLYFLAAILLTPVFLTAVQTAEHFTGQIAVDYDYLIHVPQNYDPLGTDAWPLVLYLHGSGERGNNVDKVRTHGPPKFLDQQPGLPAIVVSPQCPSGKVWQAPKLKALLDELVRQYRIDEKRIYLTGNSMGGEGTWLLASTYPGCFAAIAPICGFGSPGRVKRTLKDTPVWVFHGLQDKVVEVEESLVMVRALESVGGNFRLTIYQDADHDSWTVTYENPEFWDWLLSQSLPDPLAERTK